ncbi:FAD-dependent oxidoreductase [Nocardioides sp. LHD-245]|uniref:flavin monoamine oxidase family protein n=1 Tax=Nocardioides sp. LHD-245 TaxID=3051387 RepID=UPI0027E1E839|nr:FAD-dependent oxidoreductase [Nocardioides sp. LHD-245]
MTTGQTTPDEGVTRPAAVTMLGPDFPFGYDEHLAHPDGLGSVPVEQHGGEVAIVGGGLSGLVAAYELMRLGLKPVVYEADRIGGRLRSQPFGGPQGPIAELGGMRFPLSSRALFHYIDRLGLRTSPFPNPLSEATPSTVVELGGESFYARTYDDLPPLLKDVADAWHEALGEVGFAEAQQAIADRDVPRLKDLWNQLVPTLDEETFSGFLANSLAFGSRSFRHREVFGQVGFGTGGWDTDFPNSMLEILRVIFTNADEDHRLIHGGAEQLPVGLWKDAPACAHWPEGTSLESLHGGSPMPGVARIMPGTDRRFEVTDRWGTTRAYDAVVVTCQVWLLSARIDVDESLFSPDLWMAMERTHYMQSSKTFVRVDRPFWRDTDPTTGRDVMSMTLTDRLTRATYLLEDDGAASICLSYTWNDDALKWLALPVEERVRLQLHSLRKIYPGVDIASHIVGDPITVSWESDPNFMGAFKANLPGHYRYQRRLFSHFVQDGLPAHRRGIFLAGDDISWTAGWAEGAVTTALNAVWGVVRHFGGSSAPGNPGPGDRFADLAPLALPDEA